ATTSSCRRRSRSCRPTACVPARSCTPSRWSAGSPSGATTRSASTPAGCASRRAWRVRPPPERGRCGRRSATRHAMTAAACRRAPSSWWRAGLQRPAVLAAIALVLIVLAASNLGLYTFRVPAPLMRRVGRVGDGVLGAFFMGLTMGIVAAPCIGPIVVALLLFVGSRQSAALGFALFFTLALGMGAPYVGLAAAAGRLRRLPRSGPWLEWVERAFAFLLLGLAVYFLAPLLRAGTVRAAYAFLGVAAGIVLGFLTPGDRRTARWSRQLAGLVLVAVSLGWLISADAGSPITWVPVSEAGGG